ncbi:uncharacterized protein LOC142149694 [Mixophyes fleayi]|uniref:uncharacterized protein LOC142149694 n=1 Tax=Mixophyes fleayi TaxID=3061075 RepID=UPI003F4DA09D
MSLSRWFSSVFHPQRPTSSHLHLLNENQPLQNLQPPTLVELTGARPIGVDGLNALFQETIFNLGGKESILLVGEAGCSPENDGVNGGMLEDLSFALFQLPEKHYVQRKEDRPVTAPNKALSCVTSKSPSKSRMLEFPVILAVFWEKSIMDPSNRTLMKEILRDVKVRTRKSRSKVVGIIYTREPLEGQKNSDSKQHLHNLMSHIFKGQLWGVCCYSKAQPKSILEVKWTIMETLEGKIGDQDEYTEDQTTVLERSFRDLVYQLGGKERFLLLGNICPSIRPSERAGIFKEITKALFDDTENFCDTYKRGNEEVTLDLGKDVKSPECIQLPHPKPFPYPLILVVFTSTFLKEDVNRAQVKEILTDVKMRVKKSSTQVVGVVCSQEPMEEVEEKELHALLQKILHQTFSCPTGVCSFVRDDLESVDGVKRCVCHVLKQRN